MGLNNSITASKGKEQTNTTFRRHMAYRPYSSPLSSLSHSSPVAAASPPWPLALRAYTCFASITPSTTQPHLCHARPDELSTLLNTLTLPHHFKERPPCTPSVPPPPSLTSVSQCDYCSKWNGRAKWNKCIPITVMLEQHETKLGKI